MSNYVFYRLIARVLFGIAIVGSILLSTFAFKATAQADDQGNSSGVDRSGNTVSPEQAFTPEQALAKFTENLTEKSHRPGRIFIGKLDVVRRAMETLYGQGSKVLYVFGEAGTGKTALVEEVASKLNGQEVYSLDVNALIAGTTFRGELEDRVKALIKVFTESNGQKVLFIDEFHVLKADESGGKILDILKPAMADGRLSVIAATTLDEYRKIETDPALTSRGQVLTLELPSKQDVIDILRANKPKLIAKYQSEYNIRINISDRALEMAARLAFQYGSDEAKIREALKYVNGTMTRWILERTFGNFNDLERENQLQRLKLKRDSLKADLEFEINKIEIQEQLDQLAEQISALENMQHESHRHSEKIASLRTQIKIAQDNIAIKQRNGDLAGAAQINFEILPKLEAELRGLEAQNPNIGGDSGVNENDISRFVATEKGLSKIGANELDIVNSLSTNMKTQVINQDHLTAAAERALKIRLAGVSPIKGPKLSMLVLGPTGVGKTEWVKALAEFYMGDRTAINKINMTNYTEKESAWTLIGPGKGYQGSDEGGTLTEPTRRRPRIINYLDEMGSEHRSVTRTLMDPLDEGRGKDGIGRTIDYSESILVASSNLGADYAIKKLNPNYRVSDIEKDYGFAPGSLKGKSQLQIDDLIGRQIMKQVGYADEFINRFDVIAVANALTIDMAEAVAKLKLEQSARHLLETKGISLKFSDAAIQALAAAGYEVQFGARPIERKKKEVIDSILADIILEVKPNRGSEITVDFVTGISNSTTTRGQFVAKSNVNGNPYKIDVEFKTRNAQLSVAKAASKQAKVTPKTGVPKLGSSNEKAAAEVGEAGKAIDPLRPEEVVKRAAKGRARK